MNYEIATNDGLDAGLNKNETKRALIDNPKKIIKTFIILF
jgi:hypothetical protein